MRPITAKDLPSFVAAWACSWLLLNLIQQVIDALRDGMLPEAILTTAAPIVVVLLVFLVFAIICGFFTAALIISYIIAINRLVKSDTNRHLITMAGVILLSLLEFFVVVNEPLLQFTANMRFYGEANDTYSGVFTGMLPLLCANIIGVVVTLNRTRNNKRYVVVQCLLIGLALITMWIIGPVSSRWASGVWIEHINPPDQLELASNGSGLAQLNKQTCSISWVEQKREITVYNLPNGDQVLGSGFISANAKELIINLLLPAKKSIKMYRVEFEKGE